MRTLKIRPRNLKDIVRSWIRLQPWLICPSWGLYARKRSLPLCVYSVVGTPPPHDDAMPNPSRPMCPRTFVLGRCVSWKIRSFWRYVPRMKRPMDDKSKRSLTPVFQYYASRYTGQFWILTMSVKIYPNFLGTFWTHDPNQQEHLDFDFFRSLCTGGEIYLGWTRHYLHMLVFTSSLPT